MTFHGDGVLVVAQGNVIGDRLELFFCFGTQRVVITVKEHIALGGVGNDLVVFGVVGVVGTVNLVGLQVVGFYVCGINCDGRYLVGLHHFSRH